ncbi:MAG: acylphosphatase [bacterium]|nr:acylphosphatase [bacterium]MDZ4343343.1 acylphosphatase [Candidatus Binatia bacterium]
MTSPTDQPRDNQIGELCLLVSGRVQGVFYRATVRRWARELKLNGYAKNLPDGRVEIVAQGSKGHLATILRQCYNQVRAARVEHIDVTWRDKPSELYKDFIIL